MIVVDGVVFSEEVWEWFSERTGAEMDEPHPVRAFAHLKRVSTPECFESMTGWDLWLLLDNVLLLMSDMYRGPPLDPEFSPADVREELEYLERAVVHWALRTTPSPDIGKLEEDAVVFERFTNAEGTLFNRRFQVQVCYKIQACWSGFEKFSAALEGVDLSRLVNVALVDKAPPEMFKAFRKYVARAYGHDFFEFVISCMEEIKKETVTHGHTELAKVIDAEMRTELDVDTYIQPKEFDPTQTWVMLYNTYFDEEQDDFNTFFETFSYATFRYFIQDYLHESAASFVQYLPLYRMVSSDGFDTVSRDPLAVVDMDKLRDKVAAARTS